MALCDQLEGKYNFLGAGKASAYSKSSPNPLDVPVLRACLPSTLSIVEYLSSHILARS